MSKLLLKRARCILFLVCCMLCRVAAPALADAGDLSVKIRAQDRQITGKLTDTSGAALPGVSVSVKNSPGMGTSTDLNGKYVLDVPDAGAVLVFSLMGFETLEVPVGDRTVINAELQVSTSTLEDVVVVAFGEQKKQDVIGAVTTVNPSELKVPSSNLTTALAGRIAGVIAYQRSGEPGQDNADFFIRGVTTFGYKTDPLILIDGIELTATDLARLQPDDVASFSIMKDATATALYGARGANGVILVTTKEGSEGKARVSFRLENSISTPTQNVELADPITYMKLHNEAMLLYNPLLKLPYSQKQIDNTAAGTNPYAYPATNWRDALFKDYTMNQRANFSVGGGGKVARYYLAGTFNQDNGVLEVDGRNNFNNNIDLKSYLLRSNVNINLTSTTEVGVKLYGTFDDYTGPINGGADLYRGVMRTNPVRFPAYFPVDESHQYVRHIMFGNYDLGASYLNPYAEMVKGYKEYSSSLMMAQFELKQDLSVITPGLSLQGMINTNRRSYYDVSRFYEPFYYQMGTYDKSKNSYTITQLNENEGTDYLDYEEGDKLVTSTSYVQASANYTHTFAEKHGVSGMLVFMMNNIVDANSGNLQTSLPHRNLGLSGRFTYSYDSRYFGEFNFGYNGSERFYKDKRFGFFPSGGVAWYVSNEDFWEPVKEVVSNLKLRATYGLVGNDAIGRAEDRFFYLSNVEMNDDGRGATFGTNYDYIRSGVSISRYDNRDITWETALKTNIGIEIGLFEKVNIVADIFHEDRTNILMARSFIPTTMGLSSDVYANLGEASSRGIDLSIDYQHFINNDFWVQARGNFTYSTSEYEVYEEPVYQEGYLSHEGYSLNQQWGYIAERLFVDELEILNSPRQNFGEYHAGDIKYRDVNGDGQITTRDQVPIGYPTVPEIVYGFGFSTGYKNFDFSAFFQGLARESFWIDVNATAPFVSYRSPGEVSAGLYSGYTLENQLLRAYANDYWSEDDRDIYALWPRLSATNDLLNNNAQKNTWFMRNGAFIRLKTVELGYTLPQRITERWKVEKTRIYLSGINLLTFSDFDLWDIEMAGQGLGYPLQKVYNIGVQVSF
ncbi:TonB-linked SusC/RagA family outer membrane protein [Anseongella ginsenosidimutans]|uniref:TonB-linked SusC/RagA family outer membrane protein n=1 Tax=Anseongella ginsenosidimutans TaxID=496056 RepID=A0A4R3KN28_9SPHI|nr:TonB-dependent receptor [Anseongella ginsenosidimutans]QEC52425.1 TonB-dependent receptor [Anseongella ginsenosidimutans]TCS85829.1 TonB-linked SusC/RagA family outer membrane protein [Anseongella ginsenosidimutans]